MATKRKRDGMETAIKKGLRPPAGKSMVEFWDSTLRPLGVRMMRRSEKYVLDFIVKGQRCRGILPGLAVSTGTIAAARTLAAEWLELAAQGIDPRQATATPDGRTSGTLGALWADLHQTMIGEFRVGDLFTPRSVGHVQNFESSFRVHLLPALGEKTPVAEIGKDQIRAFYRQFSEDETPKAKRILRALSAAWNNATDGPDEVIRRWPDMAPNPTRVGGKLSLSKEERKKRRRRPFTPLEYKRVGLGVLAEGAMYQAALVTLLLTGWRASEVCNLRLADIGEVGVVTLRHTKTEDEQNRMLPTAVERLIRALPRESEWAFPGRSFKDGRDPEPIGGLSYTRTHGLAGPWRRIQSGFDVAKSAHCTRTSWIHEAQNKKVGDDDRRLAVGHAATDAHGAAYLNQIEPTYAGGLRRKVDRVAKSLAKRYGIEALLTGAAQ